MKFQLFALRRSKLGIIALILAATFLLLNSTETGWGKKIKEITDNELKEIKMELNISEDRRFHPYSDPDLKEVLDNEIDPQKAPGLTFGVFILNAIYEEKLVEMCYPHFYDEGSSRFFSLLADNFTSWQKNFAEKTTKIAIEAIIEAYKMHGLSIGISSLFLTVDLAQIGVAIMKLAEVVRNRALSYYMSARGRGDSHEVAWSVAGISPLYDNWQTQEFFKSLWSKYEKHMSEDGLDKDFAQQEREKLRTSFLDGLRAQAHPVITASLKISPPPPYHAGDRINAEFTITNKGTAPIAFNILTVGGRDPDSRVADFTFRRDITLSANNSYNYKGSLTLAKAGNYHFFCAYQTLGGKWNPSVDLGPGLTDEDRVKDIIVKEKEEISFKSFYYKDNYAEYSVKYPDWPVSPSTEKLEVIEEQGGKGMVVVKATQAGVGIGVFRLPPGGRTVQAGIRDTIREAKEHKNLHSDIDLKRIKEEIGRSQILTEKVSSDEDFIEAIIDRNSENFATYAIEIELDGSEIHVYAETVHLRNGKHFAVTVIAVEDNWPDYRDIAEYVIDSMQVKVIGKTQVKRRSPLSPIIQTAGGFYRSLDVGNIDELQKHLSPRTSIEQFSITKDMNSRYSPILHHVTTVMKTENPELLHESGIIVKPRIKKETLEYLAPLIERVEIEEERREEALDDGFATVAAGVVLKPGTRQECEAELDRLEDALAGWAPLLANQPINVPWNLLVAYFPKNQECRLENQNGEWKIVDIIGK